VRERFLRQLVLGPHNRLNHHVDELVTADVGHHRVHRSASDTFANLRSRPNSCRRARCYPAAVFADSDHHSSNSRLPERVHLSERRWQRSPLSAEQSQRSSAWSNGRVQRRDVQLLAASPGDMLRPWRREEVAIGMRCSQCRVVVPSDSAFCSRCGSPLADPPPARDETVRDPAPRPSVSVADVGRSALVDVSAPLWRCPRCGGTTTTDAQFCEECGSGLVAASHRPMASTSTSMPSSIDDNRAASPAALLLLGGGLFAAIGAFLPWVSVLVFNVNGVSAHWGVATLFAGVLAFVAGYQIWQGNLFRGSATRPLLITALAGGILVFAIGLGVAVQLKKGIAKTKAAAEQSTTDSSSGSETIDKAFADFGRSLEKTFRIRVGLGVWITIAGGLAIVGGGVAGLSTDSSSPSPSARATPPDWYADPQNSARLRWWDGSTWSEHTAG
jgi:hypothetical protein